MNFTLHQLKIFLEVVRLQSITRAAEAMHMTQPALSIQLKNFQNQFDIPLTEIIGKKLHVTEFGYSIAEIATNIIRESDSIKYRTKEFRGLLSGRLRISSASTGKYVIPYFINGFLKQHPNLDLTLDVSNKTEVLAHLRNNEVDFALVSIPPTDFDFEEEILLENKLFMVGSTKSIEDNKPFIFREKGSATRKSMDEYFGKEKQRKSLELTSNEAVKQAVIAGIGYSILPLIGIKNELKKKQLHIIPSKGLPIVTSWRLIWLPGKKLSPVSEAYLNFIRAMKYEIIQSQFKWYVQYQRDLI